MASVNLISAQNAYAMVIQREDAALLDIREEGEFTSGHPLFSSNCPLSRFEQVVQHLVPNRNCTLILLDDGKSGRSQVAAKISAELGYKNIRAIENGVEGWSASGYGLFEGVYVPSKAFGELVEIAFHVPHMSPTELNERMKAGEKLLLIDGRPLDEHVKMNIPGSICVPNAELPYQAEFFLPSPDTTIVVHCAGRTRSIMGAQILREMQVPHKVYSLANGTQGWTLEDLELERGSTRLINKQPSASSRKQLEKTAAARAEAWGIKFVDAGTASEWLGQSEQTTYLFDVRSDAEYSANHAPGAVHAPGGQLIQWTDTWCTARGARVILVDDAQIRAVTVARWLGLMGWDAYVLKGGQEVWGEITAPPAPTYKPELPKAAALPFGDDALLLDARSSTAYRKGHIRGSQWVIRPRLANSLAKSDSHRRIVIIGDDEVVVSLICKDLKEMGYNDISFFHASGKSMEATGLPIDATPDFPSNDEAIDFIAFLHDRHSGNRESSRRYLQWETGLVDRLDSKERATFLI